MPDKTSKPEAEVCYVVHFHLGPLDGLIRQMSQDRVRPMMRQLCIMDDGRRRYAEYRQTTVQPKPNGAIYVHYTFERFNGAPCLST